MNTQSESSEDHNMMIISHKSLDSHRSKILSEKWQWSFFGESAISRELIIKKLGVSTRYCYAPELHEISLRNKDNFINWIARIGSFQDRILWWATNIEYKNPISSDLFLNYCYLLLINEWIKDEVKKRVIIVENPWLIKACQENFHGQSLRIKENHVFFTKSLIQQIILSYGRIFLYLIRLIKVWLTNKVFILKYYRIILKIIKNKTDILIYTWVENRSFRENGNNFSDPYLGKLKDYYAALGLKAITISPPYIPVTLLKKVYKSGEIIPGANFLRIQDIMKSFLKAISMEWVNKIPQSGGLDLSLLFKYSQIQEKGVVCYNYLQYLVMLNIFRKCKISSNLLFYPFENQPWEKMMLMARNKAKSNCRLIACHIASVSPLCLNYFLGEDEKGAHPQPDVIISNNAYWTGIIKKTGFSMPIKDGGSLNSSSGRSLAIHISEIEGKGRNILVLLSTLGYSLDLIFYLLRMANDDCKFLLKTHPDIQEGILMKYLGKLPSNFNFIKSPLKECIEKSNFAIHAGTTAALDCLAHGLRVVKYLPERIDLDPLPGMDLNLEEITDKDEIDFTKPITPLINKQVLITEPFNERTWKEVLN